MIRSIFVVFTIIFLSFIINFFNTDENKFHGFESKVKRIISSAEEYGKIVLNMINKHCPNKASDDLKVMFGKNGQIDSTIFPCIIKYLSEEDSFDHLKDWILLPISKEIQELLSTMINSELGQIIVSNITESKTFKMFTDSKGNFDYEKLFVLLEKHSLKNWNFASIPSRITETVDLYPELKESLMSLQNNLNEMLQKYGFPKDVVFDLNNPLDSLSVIIDYGLENTLGYPVKLKHYAKPAVSFLKGFYSILQYTEYLSNKKDNHKRLTTNLKEPFATVVTAFELVEKNTEFLRNIMCNFKKSIANITEDFPKTRTLLKALSLVGCWVICNCTSIPLQTLYIYLIEDATCQGEKIKVTAEYEKSRLPLVHAQT